MLKLEKLIKAVTGQLYFTDALRCISLAIAAFLLVFVFSQNALLSFLGAILALFLGVGITKIYQNKKPAAVRLIHQYSGDTEYSLHLLEKDNLNMAEQLQLERIADRQADFPFQKLYSGLGWYAAAVLVSLIFYFVYPKIKTYAAQNEQVSKVATPRVKVNKASPPTFQSSEVLVQPPGYTLLPKRQSADLNVSAIYGSMISWQIRFDHSDQLAVRLANSRGEEAAFKSSEQSFSYSDRLTGSGLYSIKAYWKDSLVYQSDFYKLEALPDLAPKIEPASKELYQYHTIKDSKQLKISAKISDDFRVKQAFIVATVARGAGENVKFREVKFPLSADFREANLQKTINLDELNFSPGDELYYYWAAMDNKQPEPNFSKSDTYFLVFKDTTQIEEAELATMAVNIMPEYFRSQRQIIIDTEKLIAKRKKLKKEEFNATSNEIGFDQKVLRLRYGQYLGEEFETNIGGQAEEGNIVDAFTHHSDGTGEGAEQRAAEPTEHHDHESSKAAETKDPLAALMEQYTHAHDNAETNTFYEQSTRALLKMALEQMWQSELHLRMYEPEKALPFENKALEYLKSAQQKARTYVKKSGYDPPPIKEQEKRLTGEMKDLATDLTSKKIYTDKQTQQLVAEVLGFLEYPVLNPDQRSHLQGAGSTLSQRMAESGPLNGGLQNWPVIASLQKLVSGKTLTPLEKQALKTELYKYSGKSMLSKSGHSSEQKLEAAFWKHLR
ncbi:hypothetical protein [Dyadobacter luticola]|uniref:DUF4175 domain-containing protein n=1 Tax=Dyadobacter luticola TaxID=1979387 RepID=A0A5R9L1J0_9BACT|nr:hypothetical protein [Dyadobacter luticola]TLV02278.1 hypothetical protein FEN17_01150 [Dyadobacter luticola]